MQAITDRLYLGQTAGADFGLKNFLTLSTGEELAAPQPLKAELRHLRKTQKALSRKQKGSQSRREARLTVAGVHKRVANIRADWQWKQARKLVLNFDLLAFETLNLKAMHQLWGRKVGDLGFADFLLKAQWMPRSREHPLGRRPREGSRTMIGIPYPKATLGKGEPAGTHRRAKPDAFRRAGKRRKTRNAVYQIEIG